MAEHELTEILFLKSLNSFQIPNKTKLVPEQETIQNKLTSLYISKEKKQLPRASNGLHSGLEAISQHTEKLQQAFQ